MTRQIAPRIDNIGTKILFAIFLLLCKPSLLLAAEPIELVSVDSNDIQANKYSKDPSVNQDCSLVAFMSTATNLLFPGDNDEMGQIYVRDRINGTTERISVSTDGARGNRSSNDPSISGDGRYVAFSSTADNLVPGITHNLGQIFVRDRINEVTERVSIDSFGTEANHWSFDPRISADGRFVVFATYATNLLPVDINNQADVFYYDRIAQTLNIASIDNNGLQGLGPSRNPSINADGRFIAFTSSSPFAPDDNNNLVDVYVHDRIEGTTECVSKDSNGLGANGNSGRHTAISANGRFVAFSSEATNLVENDNNSFVDVFVHDRESGATERISVDSYGVEANGFSDIADLSADGRYVTFFSCASNLVLDDNNGFCDVFLHDRETHVTELVSVNAYGIQGNDSAHLASISSNGNCIAFATYASNMILVDENGHKRDVLLRDLTAPLITDPGEMLIALIAQVESLNLSNGISNSLDAKILSASTALADLNENNNVAACNALEAFVNSVTAQAGQQIRNPDALGLISFADIITSRMQCN